MKRKRDTTYEDMLQEQLDTAGLKGYERERTFIPGRRFKADFYWPEHELVVEVDGGLYMSVGGHTGKGREADYERDYLAALAGLTTLRFSTGQVRNGDAIKWLKRYFRKWGLT